MKQKKKKCYHDGKIMQQKVACLPVDLQTAELVVVGQQLFADSLVEKHSVTEW